MSTIRRDAVFSADLAYRYLLTREWGDGPRATFVMLNPSTADADSDDPTLRRCLGFATAWGMGSLHVVNVYAYRSTDPRGLWGVDDPVGPENDAYLREAAASSGMLVAAWGAHARPERVRAVLELLGFDRLTSLATTGRGAPRHPLYLRRDLRPTSWPTVDS